MKTTKKMFDNIGYELMFEHASEGLLLTSEKGEIFLANRACHDMFGYQPGELVNQEIEILIPRKLEHDHKKLRAGYNKNPHARSMGIGIELYGRKKDDTEFAVEVSLSPFSTAEHKFIIVFIIDISVRKEIEKAVTRQKEQLELIALELKQSNERLETKVNDRTKVLLEALNALEKSKQELSESLKKERELNELKSRFLSMASHEFRTPLTTILSSASLITEYKSEEQDEKRVRHVNRIKSAVNNLNDILSDFISISRIEEGKVMADIKKFNLSDLTAEVINEIKLICKPGQLLKHIHSGEEIVLLDPKMSRNILMNLISNAIKFSGENAVIEITTQSDDQSYLIQVKDQGIGISNEDKKHLFERFFRGQNVTNIQGTGLGLNIVANYVDLMGGRITVHSELNEGTTFKLKFSVAEVIKKSKL